MNKIIACIDGSPAANNVFAASAWAQQQLGAPLELLHVLEKTDYPAAGNMNGNIGLGTREHLLEELAELDNKRSKLMLEQGRLMLAEVRKQVEAAGVPSEQISQLQRHDSLIDTLLEGEATTRLLVMGRQGESHDSAVNTVGSHLENVTRTLQKPILVALDDFTPPERFMLAYDGSNTANKALHMVLQSPLFKGIPCHLVMAGKRIASEHQQLIRAENMLEEGGVEVITAELEQEDVRTALLSYVEEHEIGMMVMGAWGHSRIRQLLVGSMTNWMLHNTTVPLLLIR